MMDPAEERRDMKRLKEYYDLVGYVADGNYGIPTSCPCGGRIINEVMAKEDFDTLPGKLFFACINYEEDGTHLRQPWVVGVEEEIKRLTKRVNEAEHFITRIQKLNYQIETLKEQVEKLTGQVEVLEKLCIE